MCFDERPSGALCVICLGSRLRPFVRFAGLPPRALPFKNCIFHYVLRYFCVSSRLEPFIGVAGFPPRPLCAICWAPAWGPLLTHLHISVRFKAFFVWTSAWGPLLCFWLPPGAVFCSGSYPALSRIPLCALYPLDPLHIN